jgi:hypothetical protein
MAHQSNFRRVHVERNAHQLRMQRSPLMNDPATSGLDRIVHAERLRDSPLMQRRADENLSPADRVIEEAVAEGSSDDLRFFPRGRS